VDRGFRERRGVPSLRMIERKRRRSSVGGKGTPRCKGYTTTGPLVSSSCSRPRPDRPLDITGDNHSHLWGAVHLAGYGLPRDKGVAKSIVGVLCAEGKSELHTPTADVDDYAQPPTSISAGAPDELTFSQRPLRPRNERQTKSAARIRIHLNNHLTIHAAILNRLSH
jgi:hypothetical protein